MRNDHHGIALFPTRNVSTQHSPVLLLCWKSRSLLRSSLIGVPQLQSWMPLTQHEKSHPLLCLPLAQELRLQSWTARTQQVVAFSSCRSSRCWQDAPCTRRVIHRPSEYRNVQQLSSLCRESRSSRPRTDLNDPQPHSKQACLTSQER